LHIGNAKALLISVSLVIKYAPVIASLCGFGNNHAVFIV
jgi:hypothetical protein